MRLRRVILRADAREFLAAPRPERPDGRRTVTILIAFGSGKCTTRRCGQTASISFLLILGILGGRANVGIGPYKRIQNHVRVDDSARLFHNEFALPAHT